MYLDTALCLADHINDNSTRFTATVLLFEQQAWVILRDNRIGHSQDYVEPIVNVADYLQRAERRSPRLEDQFRVLLLLWLEMHPEERAPEPAPERMSFALTEGFSRKFRF
jgi:hypothetical protein